MTSRANSITGARPLVPRVELTFAAHSQRLWDSDDPTLIAPWAQLSQEPVFVRVALWRGTARLGTRACAIRIPPDEDGVEYLASVADAMEKALRRTAAEENP